jgi:hypothetical protein
LSDDLRRELLLIEVMFNERRNRCNSVWAFEELLKHFDEEATFELWLKTNHGPMICMLRNEANAFLMYLRAEGDAGFTSRSTEISGTATFRLSNGQEDEYPLSWCVEIADCYKALVLFFSNNGDKPDSIIWHTD